MWSDEFVDINSILPEVYIVQQDMALTIKKYVPRGILYAVPFALRPNQMPMSAHFMCGPRYIMFGVPMPLLNLTTLYRQHSVSNTGISLGVFELRGTWRGYDESFRALRVSSGGGGMG